MRTRVLFLSGREAGYIRNRVLLAALRAHFDVTVLTPDVRGTLARTGLGLARSLLRRPPADVCFAGFYGQPIALALSILRHEPLLLDAYVSTYDTLCDDRRLFPPRSPMGRLAFWLDRQSCRVADRILTDTRAHAGYFARTFGVPEERLEPVYVGCDETLFFPREADRPDRGAFHVFYYGAFLPLHGTEVIVEAAALLRHRTDIHFTLGGHGPLHAAVRRRVAELGLSNVDLPGWIPLERLPDQIACASLCLGGHFSRVPKAARVISTKTFQFLAMGRPTLVGDNAATREVLAHGQHAWAVPMGDAPALSQAVERLAGDPGLCASLAHAGYQRYVERLSTSVISAQMERLVSSL